MDGYLENLYHIELQLLSSLMYWKASTVYSQTWQNIVNI